MDSVQPTAPLGSLHLPCIAEPPQQLPAETCSASYQRGPQVIGGLRSPIPQPHVHDPTDRRLLAGEVVVVLVIWGRLLFFLIPG